jgi:putative chitinase
MDYPLIKRSKNATVKDLQTRLNKLGAGLIADGDFGDKTEIALFKYTGKKIVNNQAELNAIGVAPVSSTSTGVDYNKLSSKVPADVLPSLIEAMKRFEINTVNRVCHFVSQCAHESLGFTFKSENLNYSAEGLRKTFAKYFPDDATAKAYARQPEKIANRVYASRYGNGMETSGDGWRFRGKGYAQLTFKDNYVAFGKAIGEDLTVNPELVATPKYASLSACWFFSSKGLNALADTGSTDDVVKQITLKINGGYNGLADRLARFKDTHSLFQ